MSRGAPEGWTEVFHGACLGADLVEALLAGSGLHVVVQRLNAELLWPTAVFDECRVYVPVAHAAEAVQLLADASPRLKSPPDPPYN